MVFFAEEPADAQALAWAHRLMRGLRMRKLANPKAGYADGWARSLARLRKEYGAEAVQRVLDGYIVRLGSDFLPRAYTAEAFRRDFAVIRKAIESEEGGEVVITPRNLGTAARLAGEVPLPVEVLSRLPLVVQRTRTNWSAFRTRVLVYTDEHSPHSRECAFVRCVLFSTDAGHFTESWVRHLGERLGKFEHYTGSGEKLHFRPEHPWFREAFWHQWSADWCQDPTAFDPLLTTLTRGDE